MKYRIIFRPGAALPPPVTFRTLQLPESGAAIGEMVDAARKAFAAQSMAVPSETEILPENEMVIDGVEMVPHAGSMWLTFKDSRTGEWVADINKAEVRAILPVRESS